MGQRNSLSLTGLDERMHFVVFVFATLNMQTFQTSLDRPEQSSLNGKSVILNYRCVFYPVWALVLLFSVHFIQSGDSGKLINFIS